jgi:hypothetical protein
MMREVQHNLSPGVDLETAYYLTDPKMFREYERLRDASFRSESILEQLWRIPRFRRKMIEFTRLGIFALLVWAVISTISRLGLWQDIYHVIVTAL